VGAEVACFSPGDRVACAGAGWANHAEFIEVPVNLAIKIPEGLGFMPASSVTLGAIALQAVRRASPTLGETFVVIGLGALGQLAMQLLKNSGVAVIGVDPDPNRVCLALTHGMDWGINPREQDYLERVYHFTNGFGADAAVIAASGRSESIVNQAMKACRRKGRVVLLGDVVMNLDRSDLYRKELDLFISTSYGPGRYDPAYEESGHDYPLPYVRWTENRNMEAYLALLGQGRISLERFCGDAVDVDDAPHAYAQLAKEEDRPLLVFIRYPDRPQASSASVMLRPATVEKRRVRVGVIGTGGFARAVHLPNLNRLRNHYEIRAVMNRTGSTARLVAETYGAAYATTELEAVLNDPAIDLVVIATRHHLHGCLVLQALQAGKNVLVEKPLATESAELDAIESCLEGGQPPGVLMTGFNRRFSPPMQQIAKWLTGRSTPLVVNYRMNPGFLPPEHWVHGPEGGGRNIGEACHIYDLFHFLTGAAAVDVQAAAITPRSRQWRANDNFVATLTYYDGSVCTLTYTAQGAAFFPKERMEIFVDGRVISLDDYRSLDISDAGSSKQAWKSKTMEKGHLEELQVLAQHLTQGGAWPISAEQQIAATRISFEIERQIRAGRPETPPAGRIL
jgi:predicted dehydrogenase/threonine dehydrogenase-like Zn-dependent dehydrogenase